MSRRLGYVDPPYLGCCGLYDHSHPEGDRPFDGRCWDDPETHRLLISWADDEFDGWALSASSPSLRTLLPMCPPDVRVGPWTKTFASFKPNVNPGYCWEPVIFRGARPKRDRSEMTVRDFLAAPITLRKGFTGAKPPEFTRWVLDFLGAEPGDEVVDVFHGSGAVADAIDAYFGGLPSEPGSLFAIGGSS